MRFLYVTNTRLDRSWAPAHHVLGFCQALAAQGHELSLIHPWPRLPTESEPAWLQRETVMWSPNVRGGGRLYHWPLAQRLRWRARTIAADFDILYIRFAASASLARALEKLDIPKVLEVNGSEELASEVFPACARAANLVLVDSEPMADMFRRRLPDQASKVAVHVSPATDTRRFVPMDKRACRAALGVSADCTILLYVSCFWSHHDFATAIEALRRLDAAGHEVRLILLGDGPRWRSIRASVDDLVRRGRVVMPGAVPIDRVPLYINAADVCMNLWKADHLKRGNLLGFKLYEYAACARPVIESADGELPLAGWAKNALCLVPPEAPADVVDAVGAIMDDPGTWSARCAYGREYVRVHRSWDAAARSTVEKIEALRREWATPSRDGHRPRAFVRRRGVRATAKAGQ